LKKGLKGIKSNSITKTMTTSIQTPAKVSKRVSKAVPITVEPTPVPVVEPVIEPVVEETPVETPEEETTVETQINALREKLSDITKVINEQLKVFKTVDQELKKLSVIAKKEFKKKAKKNASKKPSNNGFNAPVKISNELADFLKVPRGSEMRPPQVSSLINKYANENGLKQENNKAYYNCDSKLKKLLGPLVHPIKISSPELGLGVSIFNLNSYLKTHYTKIPVVQA
jgi:chromatin remodeling complex protein RSC6